MAAPLLLQPPSASCSGSSLSGADFDEAPYAYAGKSEADVCMAERIGAGTRRLRRFESCYKLHFGM